MDDTINILISNMKDLVEPIGYATIILILLWQKGFFSNVLKTNDDKYRRRDDFLIETMSDNIDKLNLTIQQLIRNIDTGKELLVNISNIVSRQIEISNDIKKLIEITIDNQKEIKFDQHEIREQLKVIQ